MEDIQKDCREEAFLARQHFSRRIKAVELGQQEIKSIPLTSACNHDLDFYLSEPHICKVRMTPSGTHLRDFLNIE